MACEADISFRHPGLDPGSIPSTPREWIPDQVRDDDCQGGHTRPKAAFSLKHIFAEVGVADDVGELAVDIGGVDVERRAARILGGEADFLD